MTIDLEALAAQLAAAPAAQRESIRRALYGDVPDASASLDRMTEALRATDERLAVVADRMAEGAEAQLRTGQHVAQLAVRMDQLTDRVDQLAVRMDQLTDRVDQLAVRMDQLTARVDELAKDMQDLARSQAVTDAKLADLVDVTKGMNDKLGRLDGESFERRCREKGHGRFGRVARRLELIDFDRLAAMLDDGETAGTLTEHEVDSVLNTDAVFRGALRPEATPVHLLIEASVTVNHHDVRRARERADLLARVVDTPVVAVVAGEFVPHPVGVAAQDADVWQVVPGGLVRPTDDLPEF